VDDRDHAITSRGRGLRIAEDYDRRLANWLTRKRVRK